MEYFQNLYGLFVVYRYMCLQLLLFLSKLAFDFTWFCTDFQTCSINRFALLKWLSIQHSFFLTLIITCFFPLPSNKANLICHLLVNKIYIDKPPLNILCRVS